MSKNKGKTAEELLQEALVPEEEQPYKVPENWAWVKLGSISRFIDYRGKTPNKTNNGIPLITAKNVRMNQLNEEPREYIAIEDYDKWMTRGIPNQGDILFTTEAPLGYVAELNISGKVALAQRIITIQSLNNPYLKFALMSPQIQENIKRNATGTTVAGIKASKLKLLPVPIPPMNEQKRIADKVERLLNKINQAKQLIEEAKETFELRRAVILDKAFRGELTEKWREENLSKATAGSFLQKIDELRQNSKTKVKKSNENIMTEPYKLPEGWRWVPLEDLIQTSSYGTSAKTNDDEDVPVLRMGNIIDGELHLHNLKYLPSDHKDVEKYKLEEYDLLFNRTNSYELVGKTAVVYGQASNMTYASYLVNVRLFYKEEIAEYICYYINGHFGRNLLLSMVTQQVGQANINASKLASLIVPLPPEEEIVEITKKINSLIENERSIKNSLQLKNDLDKLTEAVLYSAFRGDLGTNDGSEPSEIRELLKLEI